MANEIDTIKDANGVEHPLMDTDARTSISGKQDSLNQGTANGNTTGKNDFDLLINRGYYWVQSTSSEGRMINGPLDLESDNYYGLLEVWGTRYNTTTNTGTIYQIFTRYGGASSASIRNEIWVRASVNGWLKDSDNKAIWTKIYTKNQVDTLLADKQNTITGGASSIVTNNLTTSRALVSSDSGKVASSSVSKTLLEESLLQSGDASNSQWQRLRQYYMAPRFLTSSTYELGDYCTYNGVLYRCTTAVTTAGDWDVSKWASFSLLGSKSINSTQKKTLTVAAYASSNTWTSAGFAAGDITLAANATYLILATVKFTTGFSGYVYGAKVTKRGNTTALDPDSVFELTQGGTAGGSYTLVMHGVYSSTTATNLDVYIYFYKASSSTAIGAEVTLQAIRLR